MNRSDVAGRVAVITGSADGLGLGLAKVAGALGMKVVLADIRADALAKAEATLAALGVTTLAAVVDVTDPAAMLALAARTRAELGTPSLLINNAGIQILGAIWEVPHAAWLQALNVNVLGVINGCNAFLPLMADGGEPGVILNVATIGALSFRKCQAPYAVSKQAVIAYTESLALEVHDLAPHVRVGTILPGPIATDIFAHVPSVTGEAGESERAQLVDILKAHGLPPEEAGRIILDQMFEGRFWISTHPELMAGAAARRGAHIGSLRTPTLDMATY